MSMSIKSRMIGRALMGAAMALMIGGGSAQAAEGIVPPSQDWSFNGVFGTFDKASAQRGLKVYKEVCSGCHSMNLMYYRNITALGYSEDQAKAFAAQYETTDGPNDDGDYFTRAALPSDRFVAPFENEKAAAASNGGKAPPDLSLMVKARMNGADYVYALLLGYEEVASREGLQAAFEMENHRRQNAYKSSLETYEKALKKYEEKVEAGEEAKKPVEPTPPKEVTSVADFGIPDGGHFNVYFPGHQIAMAPPLFADAVEYDDGTPATVEQMAKDVANFLAWTAEPEMEDRKGMGVQVFLFLLVFLGLAIANKKRLWAKLH